jgi:hypothetical protein
VLVSAGETGTDDAHQQQPRGHDKCKRLKTEDGNTPSRSVTEFGFVMMLRLRLAMSQK